MKIKMAIKSEKIDDLSEVNINEVCRVCSRKSSNFVNIFSSYVNKSQRIAFMIMSCASVQIYENDGLPQQICNKCSVMLNIAYEFKQECEDTDLKFRRYIQLQNTQNNDLQQCKDVKSFVPFEIQQIEIHANINKNSTGLEDISTGDEDLCKDDLLNNENHLSSTISDCSNNNNDLEVESQATKIKSNTKSKIETKGKKRRSHKSTLKEFIQEVDDGHGGKIRRVVTLHQCDTCGKTFTRREYLTQHTRIHTGEKPYHCHLCEKRFINSGHLTTHMRTHTGIKPHKCTLCPKAFSTKQELTKHTMVHNGERPFQCKICGKRFGSSSNLYTHLKHHTGEKNFTCDQCGKAFYTKQELKQHFVVHTGEKPFLCEICEKRFSQIAHLRRHSKLHKRTT